MEPRKASEVLLELEAKLDLALNIIRTQDLNIKVMSNKLNLIQQALDKGAALPQKIMVEAANVSRPQVPISPFQQFSELDAERQIPISSEASLPIEASPNGFRRTSRPETFAGDDAYLPQAQKYPVQLPKVQPAKNAAPPGRTAEAVVPQVATQKIEAPKQQMPNMAEHNSVPVMQRVVNSHGRSLFLADVEIIDLSNMSSHKTRTNGSGKWMAALLVGNYRVIIKKYEPATKETLEATQDIQVDGSTSPLELQALIIKST